MTRSVFLLLLFCFTCLTNTGFFFFFLNMKINRFCREGSSWAGKLCSCMSCSVAVADTWVQAGCFCISPNEVGIWEQWESIQLLWGALGGLHRKHLVERNGGIFKINLLSRLSEVSWTRCSACSSVTSMEKPVWTHQAWKVEWRSAVPLDL